MLKNERPNTEENGPAVFTDVPEEDREAVLQWISEQLIPGDSAGECHSSYGLKHLCEYETGIYLTNRQFKDAMLEAGYEPEDEDALNWYYGIRGDSPAFLGINREVWRLRQTGFVGWMQRFREEDSHRGVFARDLLRDFDFPVSNDYEECRRYLRHRACAASRITFEDCWRDWKQEQADAAAWQNP